MSYPIEVKLAPKASWFTPAEAKAYYGSYARMGVTCHWWGNNEPASAHDSIVNYFLKQGAAGIKSVNYVVSDKKITCMVTSPNVAWASQNGNPVTISIEFQPTLTAEGYKRGGWLINELEKRYGPLKLYKHSFWFPTACPGTINLTKLREEATKAKGSTVSKDALTATEVDLTYLSAVHRHVDPSGAKTWKGKPFTKLLNALRASAEWKKQDQAIKNYDKVKADLAALQQPKSLAPGVYKVK